MRLGTPARRIGFILVAGYATFVVVASFMAPGMMFKPPTPAGYSMTPALVRLPIGDDSIVARYRHTTAGPARATVLFAHGNGGDLGGTSALEDRLLALQMDVLAFDYRGFGLSSGSPSEDSSYEDIDRAYRFLVNTQHVDPRSIVVLGHSLGGGPAAWLAEHRTVRSLMLVSTFSSAFNVVIPAWTLPIDAYETVDRLPHIKVPVLIVHGDADELIDVDNAHALFDAARRPKRLMIVRDGSHNAIYDPSFDLPAMFDWLLADHPT